MNALNDFLLFLVKCIYLMLPGIFANMAPVIFRNNLKFLAIPVDFGKKYNGKRLLGKNKTLRGYIVGIVASILLVYMQTLLYNFSFFQELSFIDYEMTNFLLFGFLIGFGVLFGDTVESFIKRRLRIAPGKPFIPWDQFDSIIGAIIFVYPVYQLSLVQICATIFLSLFFSLGMSYIGFLIGLRKEKEVTLE